MPQLSFPSASGREPILNLPAVVTACIAVLVVVQGIRVFALSDEADFRLLLELSVIPARVTVALDPSVLAQAISDAAAGGPQAGAEARSAFAAFVLGEPGVRPWTFLTYALLHGSWPHVLLNGVWLAAFGTPVARRCGAPRFLLLAAVAAIGGAVAHVLVHPLSVGPLVGASAAVSGLMAAAIRFVFGPDTRRVGLAFSPDIHERPRQDLFALATNRNAALFLGIRFVTNLLSGLLAGPLGITDASIAWEAHIGGFVAGLLLFPFLDPAPR